MNLRQISSIGFLGIGGIGMSALARYFRYQGAIVWGYDRTCSPLTLEMESEGIDIFYEDNPGLIPSLFSSAREELMVVYTPSVPLDNIVRLALISRGFTLHKRSVVLGKICENHSVIAVAGTHGKTTTCAMITHLLKVGQIDCMAFLGGISTNYQTNFLPGFSPYIVAEADEYDRSFLTLFPHLAVITSMDPDHLDIYGDYETMVTAYNQFSNQVAPDGTILTRYGLAITRAHQQYGVEKGSIRAQNIVFVDDQQRFDYQDENQHIERIRIQTPGLHNIENAVAAIRVALSLGLNRDQIKKGMESFLGVKRRFEYIFKGRRQLFIDDYAHHPDELHALLDTLRRLYPTRHLTVIFQPHLFSRTRDFFNEMAGALSAADVVYLLDIYPAREQPMEGISSALIYGQLPPRTTFLLTKEKLLAQLATDQTEVVVTVGAGDIDRLIEPIKNLLKAKELQGGGAIV